MAQGDRWDRCNPTLSLLVLFGIKQLCPMACRVHLYITANPLSVATAILRTMVLLKACWNILLWAAADKHVLMQKRQDCVVKVATGAIAISIKEIQCQTDKGAAQSNLY